MPKGIMNNEPEQDITKTEKESKPLIVWFDAFIEELDRLGGVYKEIEPTDMIEFYYAGSTPANAASKLILES